MKKTLNIISAVIICAFIIFMCGKKVTPPVLSDDFPAVPNTLQGIQDSVLSAEGAFGDSIKKGNASQIFWLNDSVQKTPYAVVYLHGYSASKYEGLPVAEDFANRYGMNLYMPRLQDHGFVTDEPLLNMTADGLWESAKNALAVGEKIGDKVLIMSTSTGGTLALYLASRFPKKIAGIINISPNILPATTGVTLLSGHWGLQIARTVQGGKYLKVDSTSYHPEQWSEGPRLESSVQLQALLDATMKPETFDKITAPSLTLAYYKDENHQDPTVSVEKIRWAHSLLGSSEKKYVELPTVGVHPMASSIVSKDIPAVENAIFDFTENTLKIEPTLH
ncbi:MAG: alpha/beta hydrolase [Flavobacteriales bacterium]|nr:alpha/beta hydrolase [Flavobacteriales bacterium]